MSSFLDSIMSLFSPKKVDNTPDPVVGLTPTNLQEYKPMAVPTPEAAAQQQAPKVAPIGDKLTLKNIQTAHPKVKEDLGQVYAEIVAKVFGRAHCRFIYVLRTMDEQAALYAQGRTTPGSIVTKALAGLSTHNYGMACDTVLILDGKTASWDTKTDFNGDGKPTWHVIVEIFKAHGWEWGGDWASFPDLPHFQKTLGHKPSDLLAMYKAGNVDAQGYVNI